MKILRQIAALLLMLVLPWQALAAVYMASPEQPDCHGQTVHHSQPASSHHALESGHDHPVPENTSGENLPIDAAAGHHCCQSVSTGVPHGVTPIATATADERITFIRLLRTLFIADLPQRPPRA